MRTAVTRVLLSTLLALAPLLGAAILPAPARAHAVLVDSTPGDNAVLTTPPREVALRFNARIEQRVSQVVLLDAGGRKLALPAASQRRDAAPSDRLVVQLPPLGPGSYRLQYRILATDGHATPGMIRFTVTGKGTP